MSAEGDALSLARIYVDSRHPHRRTKSECTLGASTTRTQRRSLSVLRSHTRQLEITRLHDHGIVLPPGGESTERDCAPNVGPLCSGADCHAARRVTIFRYSLANARLSEPSKRSRLLLHVSERHGPPATATRRLGRQAHLDGVPGGARLSLSTGVRARHERIRARRFRGALSRSARPLVRRARVSVGGRRLGVFPRHHREARGRGVVPAQERAARAHRARRERGGLVLPVAVRRTRLGRQGREHFFLAPEDRVTIDTFYERLHPDDREPTREAIRRSVERCRRAPRSASTGSRWTCRSASKRSSPCARVRSVIDSRRDQPRRA